MPSPVNLIPADTPYVTVEELISELSKYPPSRTIKRFHPDDKPLTPGPARDDVDVVAVIDRDGHVVVV